jgi:LemA protein
LIFLFIFAGLPLIWLIATYNNFIRIRNQCQESWSGIDTELKRRYDLIPNLVETVRGYARHEQETLTRVTEDRIQAARRFYNANVRDMNTRIEVFPSNFVAGVFGVSREEYFEIEDTGLHQAPPVQRNRV